MYNKGTCSGEGCVFSFVDLKSYSGLVGLLSSMLLSSILWVRCFRSFRYLCFRSGDWI